MAVPAERFRGITGGGFRAPDAFWHRHTEMSRLQQVVVRARARLVQRPTVHGLLAQKCRKVLSWLTRPSELTELREADAVMRLLAPTVPLRCDNCGTTDWITISRRGYYQICARCWERIGA